MTLATADADGRPSARVVLCRGFDEARGFLVFYSNRESAKGRELATRPWAAVTLHWDVLARQARVSGPVVHSPDAESDAYFAGRPRLAQIAASASRQSQPVPSRRALLARLASESERLGGAESGPAVPRPPHWGGYRLWAEQVELWVGAEGRAHDRGRWLRPLSSTPDGFAAGDWKVSRLQP